MNPYSDYALPLSRRFKFHISPPIPVGEKHPVGHPWKQYQTERTPDHTIRYWAVNYVGSNYGILTGEPANLVVLEADSRAAEQLIVRNCPVTPLMVLSGSRRGHHFYYRYPLPTNGESVYVKTRAKIPYRGECTDIDVRGCGGLVVGPGCLHKSGNRYETCGEWLSVDPATIPVFDPKWLELDTTPPKRVVRSNGEVVEVEGELSDRQELAREYLLRRRGARAGSGKGSRNYSFAVAMDLVHGFVLSADEALPLFSEWGTKGSNVDESGGYYPWTEKELYETLTSAENHADRDGRDDGYLIRYTHTGDELADYLASEEFD